jgi:hypothetical protein
MTLLSIIAAIVLLLQKLIGEDQGSVSKVDAVLLKVVKPFRLAPFKKHRLCT